MEKLISMTDFVLEQNKREEVTRQTYIECRNYANFLKQPLELWMFVPCDENNVPYVVPDRMEEFLRGENKNKEFTQNRLNRFLKYKEKYNKAKERVLFEGFEIKDAPNNRVVKTNIYGLNPFWECGDQWVLSKNYNTIEDLVKFNLTLTQTAKKQIL